MNTFNTNAKPVARISLVAFIITASIAQSVYSQSQSIGDQLSQAYTAEGNYDQKATKIKSIYDKVLPLGNQEDIALCQLYLGNCYLHMKNFDLAASLLKEAGVKFTSLNKFDFAGVCFRDLVDAQFGLGEYTEFAETSNLAFDCFVKAKDSLSAAKVKENESAIHYELGSRFESANALNEAINILEVEEQLQYWLELSWKRGETLRENHQFDDAIEQLSIVFGFNEELPNSNRLQFYSSLGKAYLDLKKYDKAVQFLETAISMDPQDSTNLGHLAHSYSNLNETQKSKALRVQIRSLADDTKSTTSAEALLACGYSLASEGDKSGATYWFKRGLEVAVAQSDREIGSKCFTELIRIFSESGSKSKISETVLLAEPILGSGQPAVYPALVKAWDSLQDTEFKKGLACTESVLDDIGVYLEIRKMGIDMSIMLSELGGRNGRSDTFNMLREAADFNQLYSRYFMSIQCHLKLAGQLAITGKPLESAWRVSKAIDILHNPEYIDFSAASGIWICSQLYQAGELATAEECAKRVLNLENLDPDEDASVRIQLFRIYYRQGDFELALASLPETPPEDWKTTVAARKMVALTALNRHEEAIRIGIDAVPENPQTYADAELLGNLGTAYAEIEKYDEALKYLRLSEAVSYKQADIASTGLVANFSNIAHIYNALGDEQEMLRAYFKGYAIAKLVNSPYETKILLAELAATLLSRNQFDAGVYFYKESLEIPTLLSSGQREPITDADQYLILAHGLLMARRYNEAYQALASTHPTNSITKNVAPKSIVFTSEELKYQKSFEEVLHPFLEEAHKVNGQMGSRTNDTELIISRMLEAVQKFADEERILSTPPSNSESIASKLASLSTACNRPVVFLRTVVYGNNIVSELQLADQTIQDVNAVDKGKFLDIVSQFRESLSSGTPNYKEGGAVLYDKLIRPFEKHIPRDAIILWWPVDSLRGIPIGALFDGKAFVAEKWASCEVPTFDKELESVEADQHDPVRLSIFAATQGGSGYSPLPGAGEETESIYKLNGIGSVVVSDPPFVNETFTSKALYNQLVDEKINVIHLATHFKASPETPWSGELLLGNGKTLSTSQIVAWANQSAMLDHLKLIVLSACETQLTGAVSQQGADYDSLGDLFIALGVNSTVTTLWKVNDAATAGFMEGFYRAYGQQGIGKAIALQQVQKSIIQGTSSIPNWGIPKVRGDNEGEDTSTKSKDIRHPHYWAPFILSGSPN